MLNRQAVDQTVRELTDIADQAKLTWTKGKTSSRMFATSDGNFYSLLNETNEKFEAIVRRLLNHGDLSAKFSETYMINCVRSVLSHAVDTHSTESIGTNFEKLQRELEEYSEEHTVYVPIQGLAMRVPDMKMGSITLRSAVGDFNKRI